jgi:rhomboid protease GluP
VDAETLLALMIGALGAVIAVQTARRGPDPDAWRWIAVNALVAVASVASVWLVPAYALPITAGLATVLIFAPLWAVALMRRRLEADDPGGALRIATLMAVVQPGQGAQNFLAITRAALRAEREGHASAMAELAQSPVPVLRLWADLARAEDEGRWQDILDLLQRDVPDHRGFVATAVRALARLGRADDMVALYQAHETRMTPTERAAARVHLIHVAGRLDAIDRLLAGPLRHLHPEARDLIRAAATHHADPTASEPAGHLTRLAATATVHRVKRAAQHVLAAQPIPEPSAAARAQIDAIADAAEAEGRLAPIPLAAAGVTLVLLALNVAAHVWVHVVGADTSDLRRLLAAGALWTPYVYEGGEWWRTLTATFLHANLTHLVLNMAVLAMVGRTVERFAGRAGYLIVYFGAGVGAFAAIVWLAREGYVDDVLVVGASGALFGLIGALLATALRWFLATRSAVHLKQLRSLGVVIVVQVAFDLLVPESSLLGHGLGFALGFVLGVLVGPLLWPVKPGSLQNRAAAPSYT